MKKRIILLILAAALLFTGCASLQPQTQYTATFLELFDTVTTILGFSHSREDFEQQAQQLRDQLYRYHQLFDIYNDYEGIHNIKTINDLAGISPVEVDPAIIQLLLDCKQYYEVTGGKVNVAMGGVLKLWHEARADGIRDPRQATLPDPEALAQAAAHSTFDSVLIDEAASTVFITDPAVSLDVGAIAKGWATQRVAESAPRGMLISVGGNVCATGPKKGDNPWVIGIQNPDGGDYLHTLYISGGAVVTSGDYQRTYVVDGKAYHHIIDPETRMPGTLWRSVTVVCQDSALADALSTALFLLPLAEGQALAEKWDAQVLWLDPEGREFMTPGFESILRT